MRPACRTRVEQRHQLSLQEFLAFVAAICLFGTFLSLVSVCLNLILLAPSASGFLRANRPGRILKSVTDPVSNLAELRVSMYVAGFPCQSYSNEGRRLGMKDKRGKLFWPMLRRLRSISGTLQCFLLENVAALAINSTHKRAFKSILRALRASLPMFSVHWRVLNSLDWGLPQQRRRVYIVGLRRDAQRHAWEWPAQTHAQPVSLRSILELPEQLTPKMRELREASLGRTARTNLARALSDIRCRGLCPEASVFAVDIDTGRKNKNWQIDRAPTLTRARGVSGGPWLTTHHRRTSLDELARLQGLNLSAYTWPRDLTPSQRRHASCLRGVFFGM